LAHAALRRHTSELRAVCANQRPYGSVRGVPGDRHPYRDGYLLEMSQFLVGKLC
jgi:hypothetical protein